MKTSTLTLNENEANALLNLMNIAVKATGLELAETALFLTKKIQESFADKNEGQVELKKTE